MNIYGITSAAAVPARIEMVSLHPARAAAVAAAIAVATAAAFIFNSPHSTARFIGSVASLRNWLSQFIQGRKGRVGDLFNMVGRTFSIKSSCITYSHDQ